MGERTVSSTEFGRPEREIRTFKPRRSRVTNRQARALENSSAPLLEFRDKPLDLVATWPGLEDIVLEIGFGTGPSTVAMAAAQPELGVLAIDVHTPGIGDLLYRIERDGLTNVRVLEGDALDVLSAMIPPSSLAGVRTYFPDPWPKARHHKRRLVQSTNAALVASRVRTGGFWHLATDIADYAEQMIETLEASPHWAGGIIERPEWRPITKFEQQAIDAGRSRTDLMYLRTAAPG